MKRSIAQRGFTLIEVLVAVAIISVLALITSAAFDGSRTKAQTMLSLGKQIGEANVAFKTDVGCYAAKPKALMDRGEQNDTSLTVCGKAPYKSWARPYLGQYPVDADGNIKADKIASGVVASLGSQTHASRRYFFVQFAGVPADIVRQALQECNNPEDESDTGTIGTDRCFAENLDANAGTFKMVYDVTR